MTIEDFIEKTSLMPSIVVDTIADEVVQYFYGLDGSDSPELLSMHDFLHSEEITTIIENRTVAVYENNESFRKHIHSSDPRPYYYSVVRHWIPAALKKRFPQYSRRLPDSFKMGERLAACPVG